MRVFVTGANGWVGSMVVRELVAAGHTVAGLVRSEAKGEALRAVGGTPLIGSLADLDLLRRGADVADGIVHTAFGLDFARMEELSREDVLAIEAFGDVFAGTDRAIVVTGGFGLSRSGEVLTEADRPPMIPGFPRASEQTAFALADHGLRASVVRLSRSTHGAGETHGFVPMLARVARNTGVSAYVGDGDNLWPAVHRLDAARMFRLAVERGGRGAAYHAVAENLPFRAIAEAIGCRTGVPARSLTPEEAETHFGALARWVAGSGPASSEATRAALGWEPREIGLIADIGCPDYRC